MPFRHIPVMPHEAVDYLNCEKGMTVADCTLGGGGHAALIAARILPGGLLVGIDRDADALKQAEAVLGDYSPEIRLVHDNFSNLSDILKRLEIETVDGVLLDLGLSLFQIEASGRGFSFSREEPLDMRMDVRQSLTASKIVNQESQANLTRIFKEYGEERYASRIAYKLVETRRTTPIETSSQLARIVLHVYPPKSRQSAKIHPATRVFMALRIAVNTELDNLQQFMEGVAHLLSPGARLVIISFHSLEDRIVKHHLRWLEKACICPPKFPVCRCDKRQTVRVITKKGVVPGPEEIEKNPLSRSARLRVAEKM